MSFWGELKRRNVFKVGVAYVIVAWVILQAISIIFPMLNLPSWTGTFVTVLIIIGFPVALVFSWSFEMTDDGVKRTAHKTLDEVVKTVIDPIEAEQTHSTVEFVDTKKDLKTIAVLPLVNLSSDSEQEYFVDGLTEEILNSLAQIPDLTVIARTSSFSFKGTNKKIQEIANELGVAHILEGSVRKSGNALRITAQLIKGADGSHLWSKTYARELKDIFAVQEDIATAVADELKVTLGIDKPRKLGGTDNLEAYELYLIARGKINSGEFNKALESAKAAVALDPDFALAWAIKADVHSALTVFGPTDRAVSEVGAALNAAERAVELEPNLAYAQYILGWIKISKGEWIEAESKYQKALKLQTRALLGSEYLVAFYYLAVGHFKKANKLLFETLQNDPLNPIVRAQYMVNLAFLGDTRRAEEEYEHYSALFGNHWPHGDNWITGLRFGSSDIMPVDIVYSGKIYNSAKEHLDTPEEGLSELHRIYANGDKLSSLDFGEIAVCAAFFGDTQFAMASMEKHLEIQKTGAFYFWLPVMHDVRQLPRFKEFVREIGLVDYWEKFGWPDLCRPTDDGDFVCD